MIARMTTTPKHVTSGWKFTYELTNKIDCREDIHDMQDIEFVTDIGKKQQKTITGFKIMTCPQDQVDARLCADQIALRLTWLLVASSGTHSEHHMKGCEEIVASGVRRIKKDLRFGYQVRNYAMANIDSRLFDEVLNGNTELAEKMRIIAGAWRASKIGDYASVIIYLVQACNEEPLGVLEKFKYLRHALSHSTARLIDATVKGLEGFGKGYFTLTADGRFDSTSTMNLHHLKIQAGEFLTHMHSQLREELNQKHDDLYEVD